MKLHARLVGLVIALCGVVGCESLPAEAPQHAALTRRYHEQTSAAVLATIDATDAALADRRATAERSLAVLRADAAANLEAVGDQLAVIEASLAAMGDAREARRRALGVELSRRLESAERRARALAGRAGDAADRADRALRELLDRPER